MWYCVQKVKPKQEQKKQKYKKCKVFKVMWQIGSIHFYYFVCVFFRSFAFTFLTDSVDATAAAALCTMWSVAFVKRSAAHTVARRCFLSVVLSYSKKGITQINRLGTHSNIAMYKEEKTIPLNLHNVDIVLVYKFQRKRVRVRPSKKRRGKAI